MKLANDNSKKRIKIILQKILRPDLKPAMIRYRDFKWVMAIV